MSQLEDDIESCPALLAPDLMIYGVTVGVACPHLHLQSISWSFQTALHRQRLPSIIQTFLNSKRLSLYFSPEILRSWLSMMIQIMACFEKGLFKIIIWKSGSFKMLNIDNKIYQMADWTERQELFFPSKSSSECGGPANTNNGVWNYF